MKWYLALILMLTLAPHPAHSQSPSTGETVQISFGEVQPYSDCIDAINLYAPSVQATILDVGEFGAPFTVESAEASGLAPECQLAPATIMALTLNRRATAISFNRYGSAEVELYRNGALVYSENTSGLGGRFERSLGGGFDYVIIRAAQTDSPLLLDELALQFPTHALTVRVDFSEANVGEDCAPSLTQFPFLQIIEAANLTITDTPAPHICHLEADSRLTLNVNRPLLGFGYDALLGAVDSRLTTTGLEQTPVSYSPLGIAHQWSHDTGLESISITFTPTSAVDLDNIWFTIGLSEPPPTIAFGDAASCQAAIEAALPDATITTDDAALVSTATAGGTAPECELRQALRIDLREPAHALTFNYSGQMAVIFYLNNESIIEPRALEGFPRLYSVSAVFDAVVITPTNVATLVRIDNLQIVSLP